jgi:hypothetical protein
LPVTSAHTYRLYIFKEQGLNLLKRRFVSTEARCAFYRVARKRQQLFCFTLLVTALLCAIESGAFYRVLKFRQTLISSAFPAISLASALRQEAAHYIDPDTLVKGF